MLPFHPARRVIRASLDAAAVTYTGPGDIVASAYGWWGTRAYSTASIGSNAIRLREDGGNTEQDFATIAGGGLDLSAISTFKGANNLFVVKVYDQSGNARDMVQATAGNQPSFILSAIGALPAIYGAAGGKFLALTANPPVPCTVSAVVEQTGAAQRAYFGSTSAQLSLGFHTSATNQLYAYNSATMAATGSDNAFHAVQNVIDTSGDVYVDGSSNTGLIGASAITGLQILADGFGTSSAGVYLTEVGIWSGATSSGNNSSMNSNQHTYYGF